jgi:hypothetical protein
MNKLGEPHMGHISNNLDNFLKKEKCKVLTYFSLLKILNVNYVDFLKIDTEGNDCKIINNILDSLESNSSWYVPPRFLLFENNNLTDIQIRSDTIKRLKEYGYVHIYTKDDNTLMYNCASYTSKLLVDNGIILPKDKEIKSNLTHYFQNVHPYIEYGQKNLFKKNEFELCSSPLDADVIWTTQSIDDYHKYDKCKKIINIIHGGGYEAIEKLTNKIEDPKIVVKSINEYKNLNSKNIKTAFFIGKYECFSSYIENIYNYRKNNSDKINEFLMLNGFFNYNNNSIIESYEKIKKIYKIDMFGYDSPNGFANTINSTIESNVLSRYKFFLHLKGIGYLCNSVIFACMCGIPIIMSRENYLKTLYYQFIPEDLIFIYENNDCNKTNPEEIIPAIEKALNLNKKEYLDLSEKLYIHGNYFRKYYKNETEHLIYFMNNLT